MITTHTRRTVFGFTGFVQVQDGPVRHSRSTHITRVTRADAKKDAEWLKRDIEAHHKH